LTEALIALSPEADWHRAGAELRCSLGHGSAIVRPAPTGGWEVERELDGVVVDRSVVHEGLDGTAAEQVADIVLGWGG
jgi:hypothetical protein